VFSSDPNEPNSKLNSVLCCISKQFQNNQSVLNLNKMYIVKFTSSKFLIYQLNIAYNSWAVRVTENIKCLGMHLYCHLTWKSHLDILVNKLGLLYAFFWVNPRRLKFICRRFGTLCLFHLHRQVGACRMNQSEGNVGVYTGKGLAWKWSEPLGPGAECVGSENRNKMWKYPRLHWGRMCKGDRTPGIHPKESMQHSVHGESLKSRKLGLICFILRKLLPIVNVKVLWMVYFAHFFSQISNGIIIWGSPLPLRNVFIIKKRAIRIMLRLGPRSLCREGFGKLDILTVPCVYIYGLMLFAVKNSYFYQTTSPVHGMNTSQQNKLHIQGVSGGMCETSGECSLC